MVEYTFLSTSKRISLGYVMISINASFETKKVWQFYVFVDSELTNA